MVDLDPGGGAGEDGQPLVGELVGAGVDEVQVEVVARQHAGQLEPDVADPEHGDRRDDGQGLEQEGDLAAAALPAVLGARLVAQAHHQPLGRGGVRRQHRPRPADGGLLEVASPDAAPGARGGDHHLGAGVARGVATHVGDGDEHACFALLAQVLDRGQPVHVRPRARCTAQNTASGVAGDASWTLVPGGPNAAAACRSASRTDRASMSGGSPTAFDP